MDILFYGEKEKEYYFSPYAKANHLETECKTLATFRLEERAGEILAKAPKELIIDADCILDEGACAEKLSALKDAIGCKVILIAIGYDAANAVLLKRFIVSGMSDFVTAASLGLARAEYESIHEGTALLPEETKQEVVREAAAKDILAEDSQEEPERKVITIGVCGCMERIGTTTLALQLAKYMNLKGRKVAYLQRNDTGFAEATKEAYRCEEDDSLCMIRIDGVDIFYDLSLIKRIMREGYDCFIYDYGICDNGNIVSILEQQYIFVCCGLKNKELTKSYEALRRFLHSEGSIFYAFNFVHQTLREQTLSMMDKKKGQTLFLSYTPEMFLLESENAEAFETVFSNEESIPERKKFKWNLRKKR